MLNKTLILKKAISKWDLDILLPLQTVTLRFMAMKYHSRQNVSNTVYLLTIEDHV